MTIAGGGTQGMRHRAGIRHRSLTLLKFGRGSEPGKHGNGAFCSGGGGTDLAATWRCAVLDGLPEGVISSVLQVQYVSYWELGNSSLRQKNTIPEEKSKSNAGDSSSVS